MKIETIIFRVDGNSKIGYGHVIRCIAFSEILMSDFKIKFACSNPDTFIKNQVQKIGELIELPTNISFYNEATLKDEVSFDLDGLIDKSYLTILDGYMFGTFFRNSIKDTGSKLICIEDIPNGFYNADAIISSNPLIRAEDFMANDNTLFYLGIEFALLRKSFRELALPKFINKNGVLIAMGGTDVFDLTPKIARRLLEKSNKKIIVLYTNGFKSSTIEELKDLLNIFPRQLELRVELSAKELIQIFDSVECAILPTSGILLEALSRKVKSIGGYYIDNQIPFATWLAENKLVNYVGNYCNNWQNIDSMISNVIDKDVEFSINFKSNEQWKDIIHSLLRTI